MKYILYHPGSLPSTKEVEFLQSHPGIKIIDDAGKAFLVEEIATHAIDEIRTDLLRFNTEVMGFKDAWIIEPENFNIGLL